jgi:predicted transcriptional regulator
MKRKKDTTISLRVNKETYEKLNKLAIDKNVSMSWIVRRAVLLYVRSEEQRTQGPEMTENKNGQ